jgi:glycerol-3-phosphate cytidylyltransferase
MIYCFDLDGTLCESVTDGDYMKAKPMTKAIQKVNELYDDGHKVIIFTGRGSSSGLDWTVQTKDQLERWGIKHHNLIMNVKPTYDIVIDDKAVNAAEWRKQNCGVRGNIAGAFDLVHPGYIRMFKECKTKCDHLTVLLHEDPSVERSKLKPVQTLEERIEILSSLVYVDEIIPYKTEEDLYWLLKTQNYDIRFLGEDYLSRDYTGSDLNQKVHFINRDHGYSTTQLKEKIAQSLKEKQ